MSVLSVSRSFTANQFKIQQEHFTLLLLILSGPNVHKEISGICDLTDSLSG